LETSIQLLVVEDEALILDFAVTALEDGGYVVVTADAALPALALLEGTTRPFCGLLTDVNLGDGITGWEVARRARELSPEIPVVYMTGDSAHEWAAQGVPNSLLLQKPFAGAQLVTAISGLLNQVSGTPPSSPQ